MRTDLVLKDFSSETSNIIKFFCEFLMSAFYIYNNFKTQVKDHVTLSEEERDKRDKRRLRNKEAAARCRQRRIDLMGSLQSVSCYCVYYFMYQEYAEYSKFVVVCWKLFINKLL